MPFTFLPCQVYLPEIFTVGQTLGNILQAEGHKDYFIDNVLSFVHLWKMRVLRNEQFVGNAICFERSTLNEKQTVVVSNLRRFLALRDQYYGNLPHTTVVPHGNESGDEMEESDDDCEGNDPDQVDDFVEPDEPQSRVFSSDWTKVITITGKPGTGKTKCVHACISHVISSGRCLVATPTGYFASTYRSTFDTDVDCETVHSYLCIPIDHSSPRVNWSLSSYDVIFIDEVSMISLSIFEHILSTVQQLSTRPILVVSGDPLQQQPISSSDKGTVQVSNIFSNARFSSISAKHVLVDQFRCKDPGYYEILNHLRNCKPNSSILKTLHSSERLINESSNVTDDIILQTVKQYPSATFVTVSKSASTRVNNVVCKNMFPVSTQLGTIQFDNTDQPSPVFKHMRVIITQNRNKPAGVVNGQCAIVKCRQGNTYILALPNGRHVSVYPVTCFNNDASNEEDRLRTCYPFVPGYALTICKCQGQTLESVVVWFDCETLGEGSAYVALSRVKSLQNIRFLTPLKVSHFKPVVLDM